MIKGFSNHKKGFTLIEIIAVIILISLLIVIAVPTVQSISKKSKIKLLDTKIKIAEDAVNLWANNNITCFNSNDGCGVLRSCNDIENNIRQCKTTFELLAINAIINFDNEVDGINYVINPYNSSYMNDYEIYIFLNNNNNMITSNLNKDSIADPDIVDIISGIRNSNVNVDEDLN